MKRSIVKLRSRLLALGSVGLLAAGLLGIQQGAQAQVGGIVFDNTNPAIKYSAGWVSRGGPGYELTMNGGLHATNTPGSIATLEFFGKNITLFYSKAHNRGKYNIRIDGKLVESGFSAFSQQTLRQVARSWTVGSVPAAHKIELELLPPPPGVPVNLNNVDLDAIVVDMPFAVEGTITDDANQQLVHFAGSWAPQINVPGAYAATNTYSGDVRASGNSVAWFGFYGDALRYYYSAAPNRGYAAVTIDGVYRGKFSQFSETLERQKPISFAGLGSGPHVVHIAVTGEKDPRASHPFIDLDRFDAIQTTGSLEYFMQTHSTGEYTDQNGTVPAATTRYHVVRVNVDDPFVTVYPQGANNAVPSTSFLPQWNPRGDNRQAIGEMYFGSPAPYKRVLISTDYFCDAYAYLCNGLDPGAPQGPFVRNATVYRSADIHSALLFEIRRVLVERSASNIRNAVGGGPRVLREGVIGCEGLQEGLSDRCGTAISAPDVVWQRRNGACVSHDRRMLYLVTTADRLRTTWRNMATLMDQLGCSDGMQFVGGRSTGLVVDGVVTEEPESAIGTGLVISSSEDCTAGLCITSTPGQRPDTKE